MTGRDQKPAVVFGREISPIVGDEDDPRAPYKVYEDDKPRGTYKTRAEARAAVAADAAVGCVYAPRRAPSPAVTASIPGWSGVASAH